MPEKRALPRVDVLDAPAAGRLVIRGGALRGSVYVLGILLSLISVPLMARYLGAVDYGRVVTVMALMTAIAALADDSLTTLGVREYTVRSDDGHGALMRAILGLRIALSLAGVAGALLVVGALAYPAVLVLGTLLAGIGLLVGSVQKVMTIPLIASLRLGTVAGLHLLEQSALVAFVALLVVAGAGLVPFFAMFLVSSLVAFVATARLTGWGITRPSVDLSAWQTLLRDMVPYGAALAISATAAVLVAMPLLGTDLEVGYFAIPVQVVTVLLGVWAVVSASTLPVLARAARDDPARLRYVLQRMIHAALVFGVGVSIITAVGADLAIRVLGGPTFEPAVPALQILAPTVAVGCVVAVWNLTLVSVRRVGWVLAVNLVVLTATLALALVLVPPYGSTGAAIAVLGGQLLYLPGFAVGLKRADLELGEPLRLLLFVALAAGIAVLAAVLLPVPTAIAIVIAAVLYAGVLVLLGAIPPELRELFSFAQTPDHEPRVWSWSAVSEHNDPTFDLVMGTLGRTAEPRRFLESLAQQTVRARVILVDQNPDDRLVPVISEFQSDVPILHLRSEAGLSRARNVGLQHLEADFVGFPDDDCWYPPGLLGRVTTYLSDHPGLGGVHGRALDQHGRPSAGRDILRPGELTRYNVWARVGSSMIFVRRPVVDAAGPFDEMLGIGSPGPWGGAEDIDFVLRCLSSGARIYYDPSLLVHHPRRRERSSRPGSAEAYRYGMGVGSVLKASRLPVWLAAWLCARGFLGAIVELVRGRPALARFYYAAGRGRLRGWLGPPRPQPRHAAEPERRARTTRS